MARTAKKVPKKSESELLSDLELALIILWNSVRRWMSSRSNGSELKGLSDLDDFLLHLLAYRNRPLRGIDLAFALSVDDTHLVTYSLKKLARMGAVTSQRIGKEVFYEATKKGRLHYQQFLDDRSHYLEPAMKFLTGREHDIESVTSLLRTMSGVYEQAARAAATAKGDS